MCAFGTMAAASLKSNLWPIFSSYFFLLVAVHGLKSNETCENIICAPEGSTCNDQGPACTICCTALYSVPPSWDQMWCQLTDNSSLTNVHVVFRHNILTSIPQLGPLPALDKLSFEYNNINSIEEFAFANLSHLRFLSIVGNNQLRSINSNTFGGNNNSNLPLEVVDLSSNALRYLPETVFRNTPNITELNLSNNEIQSWDNSTIAAINSLRNLRKLNLSNNFLRKLPDALRPSLARLISLDLSNNKLTSMPGVLQYGSQLIYLDLFNNIMTDLNQLSFIGLENLRTLNISGEKELKWIYPGTFSPLKSLQVLICNTNKNLQRISPESFWNKFGEGPRTTIKIEVCDNSLLNFIPIDKGQDNQLNCTYLLNSTDSEIRWPMSERKFGKLNEAKQPTLTKTYVLMSVGLTASFLLIVTIAIIIIRKHTTYSTLPLKNNPSSIYSSVSLDDNL